MKSIATLSVLAALVLPAASQAQSQPSETELLRQQIEQMRQQLLQMQDALNRLQAEGDANSTAQDQQQAELAQRVAEVEHSAEENSDGIRFGGAVRLNAGWRDYDEQNKDRLGDFELELFRLNVSGSVGGVLLDAEWRRYNDFQAIHHAWVGYDFSDALQMQVGITQVPFGILPYASHSFWFSGAYYLGYEDDYDTGLKWIHKPSDDWTFHYGFFKNPEYASDGRADRYSFDLVTGGDQLNTETNQLNFRTERHLTFSDAVRMDAGLSLQAGQVYNRQTQRDGDRWAAAAHVNSHFGPWNLQFQAMRYEYDVENPEGVSSDFVQKGAFGFPFLMPAKAEVYSLNLARSFDVELGPITGVTCYNNFTHIGPEVANSAESMQNVTGCSIAAGGVFAYLDWIAGKNMWFAGGDGIGLNGSTAGRWQSRLNFNIGFYF